jgi:hypothetical protein
MSLIKCKECGAEVSDKAAACVKCGAPIVATSSPKKAASGCATFIVGSALVVGVIAIIASMSNGDGTKDPAQAKVSDTCAKDDLQCLGDKGTIGASVYCKASVERLATHSVKWTDGTFDTKFSRFRWADKPNGVITYIGDKAEFQNGFGAFTPVIYECDLAPDNKQVLDVRVREGRLPE